MANIAVIYYSSTGNTYELARTIATSAEAAGANVRLRKVHESAPAAAVASNPAWQKHHDATQDVPEATLADLEWADAYAFGSPTRFGIVSAQLKAFIDTTGGLWQSGKLANKAATSFTGAATLHGGHETTVQSFNTVFAHWGAIIVPLGYTAPVIFQSGNPHGTSLLDAQGGPISPEILATARWQGERFARIAATVAAARDTIGAPPTEVGVAT